jgi:uncharacterized protein (DUF1778 family)
MNKYPFHKNHKNVTFWLLPSQISVLTMAAARSGVTKAQFIYQAIERELAARQPELLIEWREEKIDYELGRVAQRYQSVKNR